jgi:hypothetical protein
MRISTKVTLELVAAVAVLMAGFGYLAFRQERARLIDDLGQEALVRGSAIQFAVEQALRDRKIGDVPAILAEMAPAPRLVDSIRIFDRRLAEVSGTTTGVAGTPLVPRVAREQVLSTGKSLFRFRWDQPHPAVYVLLPLRSERAAVAGILEVVVGADRLQRQVRDAARGLALRVGVLGLMIALAVWLAVGSAFGVLCRRWCAQPSGSGRTDRGNESRSAGRVRSASSPPRSIGWPSASRPRTGRSWREDWPAGSWNGRSTRHKSWP